MPNTFFKVADNLLTDHYMNIWVQTYSDQSLGKHATPAQPGK